MIPVLLEVLAALLIAAGVVVIGGVLFGALGVGVSLIFASVPLLTLSWLGSRQ